MPTKNMKRFLFSIECNQILKQCKRFWMTIQECKTIIKTNMFCSFSKNPKLRSWWMRVYRYLIILIILLFYILSLSASVSCNLMLCWANPLTAYPVIYMGKDICKNIYLLLLFAWWKDLDDYLIIVINGGTKF